MTPKMAEFVNQELEEFIRRRTAIAAWAESIVEVVAESSLRMGINFGKPPFLILEDDTPYGVVDGPGNFTPLPYGYELDADLVAEGTFDAIHSVPGVDGDLIRAVPVISEYQPPDISAGVYFESAASDMPEEIWRVMDRVSEPLRELIENRFRACLVKKIARAHDGLVDAVSDTGEELPENMKAKDVLLHWFSSGRNLTHLNLAAYQDAVEAIEERFKSEDELDDEED